jgi:hypothetical protein
MKMPCEQFSLKKKIDSATAPAAGQTLQQLTHWLV